MCRDAAHRTPCVLLPQAEFLSTLLTRPGELGLASFRTKWDPVCAGQNKSAGGFYKHSNCFTDGKTLRSTVCVCGLRPCRVASSTLYLGRWISSVLTLLTSSLSKWAACYSVCTWVHVRVRVGDSFSAGAILPPRGHLARSGDIFRCSDRGGGGELLPSSR